MNKLNVKTIDVYDSNMKSLKNRIRTKLELSYFNICKILTFSLSPSFLFSSIVRKAETGHYFVLPANPKESDEERTRTSTAIKKISGQNFLNEILLNKLLQLPLL